MPKGVPAFVEPSILKWARETAGYTVDDIAKRFSKDPAEIREWETPGSDKRPFMGQLRDLANLYKRSLSDFYLPEPPLERPIPHDFRRSPGHIAGIYTPELRKQLRFGHERQELAKALSEDLAEPVSAIDEKVTLKTDPEKVGELIRSLLGISLSEQSQTGDGRGAYNLWRRNIEALGILIFQFEKVSSDEVWGFSLTERPFPVIAVNISLSPNARTFTMLHELVHILLGENSLCDIDEFAPRGTNEIRIESFCNHAAAAALMPKADFISHPVVVTRKGPATDWNDDEIAKIAKFFGASREAAVRRLLTFNRTTTEFYQLKRAQYQAQFIAQKKQNGDTPDAPFARDYAQRAVSNLGQSFVGLILNSYHDKLITLADAAKYLDVRPHKVRKVEELTVRRQE
jgi:Zn-dependent peptidase ImmA (M78 family)